MSQVEDRPTVDSSGPLPVFKARRVGTVRHDIRDVFGVIQGTHVRRNKTDGTKAMSWDPALKGRPVETMPLYRSELVRGWPLNHAIVLTEGEAACQVMLDTGFKALGTVTGATTTPDLTALTPCVGRDVLLWPDNDAAGRAHMDRIAKLLHRIALSVSIVEWADAPDHGDAVDFLTSHGADDLEALLAAAQPWDPRSSVEIIAATDLLAMDFPELRWAIEGILPEGAAVLAAAPKIGKSWLVDDWAVAIALGGFAMNSTKVDRGQVLLLPLEDSHRRMQSRLRTVLHGKDVPSLLDIAFDWPRFGEGFEDQVEAWVSTHPDARLIVVDTLAKVRPHQRTNRQLYEVDYEDLSVLASIVRARPGLALVAVHHDRKAEADDFLDSVSGSHGITGAADTVLVLRRSRGSADAVLHVTGRDAEEDDYGLRFTAGRWELTGDPIADGSEERNAIALWLGEHGPAGPAEVARALGRPAGATRMLMADMRKDGQLAGGGQAYRLPIRVRRETH